MDPHVSFTTQNSLFSNLSTLMSCESINCRQGYRDRQKQVWDADRIMMVSIITAYDLRTTSLGNLLSQSHSRWECLGQLINAMTMPMEHLYCDLSQPCFRFIDWQPLHKSEKILILSTQSGRRSLSVSAVEVHIDV